MSEIANKLGVAFQHFMARVSEGQYAPTARAQADFVSGILRSRSTVLASIARSLGEDRRLIHVEKRLSRRLASERYRDQRVLENYLKLVSPLLFDPGFRRPTIACDVTDIGKPWATKMGHLSRVRDGSSPVRINDESGQRIPVIQNGFELISVEAVGEKARRLPLYCQLFSAAAPGWMGFRPLLRRTILAVKPHVPPECIWTFDRGHDGYDTLQTIAKCKVNFVVRMKLEARTHIWANGAKMKVEELIPQVQMKTSFRIRKYKNSPKKIWDVEAGWVEEVRLPAPRSDSKKGRIPGALRLSMVVVSNAMGKAPLVMLTNMKVRSAADAQEVANSYHERWGSEEGFRFMKTQLGLEQMRVFKWHSLQRLAVLAMLAYGYLAYLVHVSRDEVRKIASRFQAFGKVPEYLFYRMLDGVVAFLRPIPKPI